MLSYNAKEIILSNGKRLTEQPFIFNTLATSSLHELFKKSTGLSIKRINDETSGLFLGLKSDAPFFRMKIVKDRRYIYNERYSTRTVALPGKRYVYLVMSETILLDLKTGKYREIPEDTRVFINISNLDGPDIPLTPDLFPWGKNLPKGKARNF